MCFIRYCVLRFFCTFLALLFLSSCISQYAKEFGGNVKRSILNSKDIQIVFDAAPAYVVLIDSMLEGDPENISLLLLAANINLAYSIALEDEQPDRYAIFVDKSFDYAQKAVCVDLSGMCDFRSISIADYKVWIEQLRSRDVEVVYQLALSWLSWIRVNASDWSAIAELSRVRLLFERVIDLSPQYDHGSSYAYLGILGSIVSPLSGKQAELVKGYFQEAIELGGEHYLPHKVYFAQFYARATFNRVLHDKLLNEVLAADPYHDEMTFLNLVAQSQAKRLLEDSDDYF